MGVIEYLCDVRFHKSLFLPPNRTCGRTEPYRMSYADYGDENSNAVVLFCGALMGTRLSYSTLDQLAKHHNVRIVHADRPGIGGSDPVDQNDRIATWLEMVPFLLAHLQIPYVSLASHSGGDIYLLNTMLTYPHLLHPSTPYITVFAPWVHHSHSGVTSLRATELLPAPLIGRFASLARFVNNNVMPLAGLSGTFLHGIKDTFSHSTSTPAPVPLMPAAVDTSRTSSLASPSGGRIPGLNLDDPAVVEELRALITQYIFAEHTDGISADAQLFLKKPQTIQWCSPSNLWPDIDAAIPLLEKIINEENHDRKNRKWVFQAFHAEQDSMVGEKGRKWFDACWTTIADKHNDSRDDTNSSLDYKSTIVPGSEHNYLMDPAFGAAGTWLREVRAAFPPKEEGLSDLDDDRTRTTVSEEIHASKSVSPINSIVLKAKRTVRRLASRRSKTAANTPTQSPEARPVLSLRNSFDDSSTRGLRKGKMGRGVTLDKAESEWLDSLRI